MKTRITIWLMCVAAVLAWTGVACAQTATSGPMVQLPSGDAVWDLTGEWDAVIENYGPWARFGTYPDVMRITQTGSAFSGIRLKDNPPPVAGRAGVHGLQGELEKNGFKHVEIVVPGHDGISRGYVSPSTGQISEDGNKMAIDNGLYIRVTLTRR